MKQRTKTVHGKWLGIAHSAAMRLSRAAACVLMIFLLIPQIVTFINLFILWIYPIKGQRLVDLQKDLEETHAKKKAVLAVAEASNAG